MAAPRRAAASRARLKQHMPLLLGLLCVVLVTWLGLQTLSSAFVAKLDPAPTSHACSHASLALAPASPRRPKLMIVISETLDRKGRNETAHVVDNFSRYCRRHGCLFKLHHFKSDPSVGLYGTRWKEALRFWDMADWLLLVDSDTLVGNLQRSLDPFLEGPEHVLLHWRGNREVTAAAVAIRTTDFGRCFINRWLAMQQTQIQRDRDFNADNGALLLLIAELLQPRLAHRCALKPKDPFELISCYEAVVPLFGSLPSAQLPIRVFPLLAGFWRQHEGVQEQLPGISTSCYNQSLVENMMFRRCWSNDILLSGWKEIGANMWPLQGTGMREQQLRAKCPLSTAEEELKYAQLCCMHQFPGCTAANRTNLCRQKPWCRAAGAAPMQARASLGFGVCKFVLYDSSWRQPRSLPKC